MQLNHADGYVLIPDTKELFGRREHTISNQLSLLDNQTATSTGITFLESEVKYVKMYYSITRGTESQVGELSIAIKSGASTVTDSITQTGATGVTFTVTHSAGTATMRYTTTSTGSAATLVYYIEYLHS